MFLPLTRLFPTAWRVILWGACGVALCLPAAAADFIYTVQPGDHPWNIAQRYLLKPALAQELFRLNRIADERRIQPGTRLRIPETWLRLQTGQVQLLAAEGEVQVQPAGSPARGAVAGEWLLAPARLLTGPTGSASLQFSDGSRVLLLRDSELRLREVATRALGQSRQITLDLLRGGMENDVRPQTSSADRFEIHTPAATAAVRGTRYRVHAGGANGTAPTARAEVLDGTVAVGNNAGQVLTTTGQGTLSQVGQAPTAPVQLLPAPDLAAVPMRIERLPIDLPMAALPGAAGYRTQLAPDASFQAIASDETTSAARVRSRDVADGRYVLRVRGIDAQGLEGVSAERALEVRARPEPPLLIEPAPDSEVAAERPLLRWTEGRDLAGYRVQLQSEDGRTVADEVVQGGSLRATALPPGVYQWRVAARHAQLGQGPWSDLQRFRRVLAAPDMQIAPPQAGALTLRWAALPGATRYQLQLARDGNFQAPLLEATAEGSQHPLQGLAPGSYQVRVRSLAADGYAGPWGSAQTFSIPEPEPEPPRHDWRLWLLLIPLLAVF